MIDKVKNFIKTWQDKEREKRTERQNREAELKKQSLELPEVHTFINENLADFLKNTPERSFKLPEYIVNKFLALPDDVQAGFLNYLYDYKPKADPYTDYYQGDAYYKAIDNYNTQSSKITNLLIGLAKIKHNEQ